TRLDLEIEQPRRSEVAELRQIEAVGVEIRLAPSLTSPRHVTGTLIPGHQASWVKRLVYSLPQTTLRGHRVAVTDRGILLVANEEIDVIPLGVALSEVAPGLLVPLGMDLVPRVAPEVLARSLGHGGGVYTVFPPEGRPFQVPDGALVPLERRALARIEVATAEVIDAHVEPPGDPAVVNDPVGRFALWGFRTPSTALVKK